MNAMPVEKQRPSKTNIVTALVLAVLMSSFVAAQDAVTIKRHTTPETIPVRALEARGAFEQLTQKEKLYAHWMSEASWWGNLITFEQLSAESPEILALFQSLFSCDRVRLRVAANRRGVSDQELDDLRTYAARFYSNCGNYLSFGDTKFIPRISQEKFGAVVAAAASLGSEVDRDLLRMWENVREKVYSLNKDELALGLEDKGISQYYGENVTRADIDVVAAYLKANNIEGWNTRVFKDDEGGLHIRFASALHQPSQEELFKGRRIVKEWGDFSEYLTKVVRCLKRALPFVANDNQRRMVLAYINHFNGGDINDHKESQRWWVKDKGPKVETNIGFIETYRDPRSVRSEWEGLVSMVNKEQTKKFGVLVENAPVFLPMLPWGKGFEKDKFQRPDFTSLEVLAFASSGIPAGINIPNYDDIRQNEGFKNVSLGNVLRTGGSKSTERITLLSQEDSDLYRKISAEAFEVQVGLHELLGHGSGKLLRENSDGRFNFDRKLKSTVDGKVISTWYRSGETWGSVFGSIASSYEECRAEGVGLYLSTNPKVLKIFGHEGEEAHDITYMNWLSMARAGISALTFYNPETQKWGQAHMQARYALMTVMLRAGDGLLKIEKRKDGEWIVNLDRSKIESVGHNFIGEFLTKLNVYKASADKAAGFALYRDYTSVPPRFVQLREFLFSKRKPRHVWVQPVTDIDDLGKVILREFPATSQGVIDSFLDRYGKLN